MAVDLLAPSIEIGLVTTNPEPMIEFYEDSSACRTRVTSTSLAAP